MNNRETWDVSISTLTIKMTSFKLKGINDVVAYSGPNLASFCIGLRRGNSPVTVKTADGSPIDDDLLNSIAVIAARRFSDAAYKHIVTDYQVVPEYDDC